MFLSESEFRRLERAVNDPLTALVLPGAGDERKLIAEIIYLRSEVSELWAALGELGAALDELEGKDQGSDGRDSARIQREVQDEPD